MSIDKGFPQPTEDELNAEPVFWLSFNPYWWRIVQGKIGEIAVPTFWDDYTETLDQAIENLMRPQEVSVSTFPVAFMGDFAGTTAPDGWLLCAGQEVSRETYADLFAVIGTTYGVGDGSTTFNLPDSRGRLSLPADNMGGTPANRVTASQADNVGHSSGAESVTLAQDHLPPHNHQFAIANNATAVGASPYLTLGNSGISVVNQVTSNTGGGQPLNTMPPYLTVLKIIKF